MTPVGIYVSGRFNSCECDAMSCLSEYCVRLYACAYKMCIYMYAFILLYVCVSVFVCVEVCVFLCMFICVRTRVGACMCVCSVNMMEEERWRENGIEAF